jgi:transcriptional regulator with XRE-family HTH domain
MGRKKAKQPKRIAKKLREIREKLELSREEMFEVLTSEGADIHLGYVSLYEYGQRVPTLLVTLAYANAARISTDYIINDKLDIPAKLPAKSKH